MDQTPVSATEEKMQLPEQSSDISPSFVKKFLGVVLLELTIVFLILGFFFVKVNSNKKTVASAPVQSYDPRQVLGAETTVTPTPSVKVIITTPTPAAKPVKKSYKIAVIGDSFEDTMGETGEYLQKSLKDKYKDTEFLIYNYGKGARTVKDGLEDFDKEFNYGIRKYPNITELKPDIIIVGSYANNLPDPYDRDWHWLTLTQLVQKAQKITSNVYVLAEVAPLRSKYGDGPSGVNWEDSYSVSQSGHVIELMENAMGLSKTLNIPLIDAYTASLKTEDKKYDKEGKAEYISVADGIHPSLEGHELMAKLIADTLKLK